MSMIIGTSSLALVSYLRHRHSGLGGWEAGCGAEELEFDLSTKHEWKLKRARILTAHTHIGGNVKKKKKKNLRIQFGGHV